jgi:TetR/AcrR family transcriptional regulator, transcriptional repressor for nem operon
MLLKKAEITRQLILEKAFELIYVKGYQATSIDEIIAATNVTKGAFFYHFTNKEEMGLALIYEYMAPMSEAQMLKPLLASENLLTDIYNLMASMLLDSPVMQAKYGCPHHNLIQEMAPISPNFKEALLAMTNETQAIFIEILEKTKEKGQIRPDIDCKQVALFIMVGYAGIRNIGKLYADNQPYHAYLALLKSYLDGLV